MGETLNEVFLEIGGGGVQFAVTTDTKGRPVLEVEASHYGQTTNKMRLLTNADTLAKLGYMLVNASAGPFAEGEYVYAAKVYEPNESTGNAESCGPEICG
jgi:hypothetical protein